MGRWGRIDEVWNLGMMFSQFYIHVHASQRYLQTAYDLCHSYWCCDQIFNDRECFLLQIKYIMWASVEIIFYWAWIIISFWENEPKLKETTVNHFAWRHYWWIEVYMCIEHNESVKQHARIVWASLISFFSLSCQVWLLTPPFFSNVSTSSI